MANSLQLEIVTPEAKVYSEPVDGVVLPGMAGELGILPNHVPLMTQLKPGELGITRGGKTVYLAVGEGFADIGPSHVSVLTDMAIEEQHIDEGAVEAAMAKAEARMKEGNLEGEEVALVQASIQKSLAQLHVKRRRKA